MIRDNKAFIQRTKDGYFNANALINDWNFNNPGNVKHLSKFKSLGSKKDFIIQLKGGNKL